MDKNKWVVVADVGASASASRTDSCGDMENLELTALILISQHDTIEDAEQVCAAKRASTNGWVYSVVSRAEYDHRTRSTTGDAA